MGGELWCGQAQNGVNLTFQVKFDLESQDQSPPPPQHRGLNQVVLYLLSKFGGGSSLNDDELWGGGGGGTLGWQTHTPMDTHTQMKVMTIPEGKNWPHVKSILGMWIFYQPSRLNWHKSSTFCHKQHMNIINLDSQCSSAKDLEKNNGKYQSHIRIRHGG